MSNWHAHNITSIELLQSQPTFLILWFFIHLFLFFYLFQLKDVKYFAQTLLAIYGLLVTLYGNDHLLFSFCRQLFYPQIKIWHTTHDATIIFVVYPCLCVLAKEIKFSYLVNLAVHTYDFIIRFMMKWFLKMTRG